MAGRPELLVKSDMCPHIASQDMWETSVLQITHRTQTETGRRHARNPATAVVVPHVRAANGRTVLTGLTFLTGELSN